jgi:polysaccharide biosynthesis/export protein
MQLKFPPLKRPDCLSFAIVALPLSILSLSILPFSALPALSQTLSQSPFPPDRLPASTLPVSTLPKLASFGAGEPGSTKPLFSPAKSSPSGLTYYLGAGDLLDIQVFGFNEYTGTQVVLPDGTITLPLIGRIIAANKTPDQLTQELTSRLKPLLKNPVVTVGIAKLRPVRINVAGEVQRPGPVQLQSLSPVNAVGSSNQVLAPTLSEAILQAGGITRNADIQQVVLQRHNPNGTGETIKVDLWQALKSANAPSDILLSDGDTIYIPTANSRTAGDRRLLAKASFSPKTIRVRVVGEVKKPGEVEASPDSTLSSAIAIAGGPTDKARLKKVVFVRMSDAGQLERRELDLQNLTDDIQVQDGDVLLVPKDGGRDFLDVASQALGPFGLILNLFR